MKQEDMSLYQDIDELIKQGAVPTDQLPAHVLFGNNALDIAASVRRTETASEMEMRVAAGNAAGLADGYYSGTQVFDENGNVTTEEEKEQKTRQKLRSNGLTISTSIITANLEFYDSSKTTALAAQSYWQERQEELLREQASLQSQLKVIDDTNDDCMKRVDTSGQAVVEAETTNEADQAAVQRLQDNIANGNEALANGKMLGGDDGKVYDVVATIDGAMAVSQDDDGNVIVRPYNDPSLIKDPLQIREIVRFSELGLPLAIEKEALSADEVEQVRAAHTFYIKDMEDAYAATLPIANDLRTRLGQIETELTEANNNLELLAKYNDPDFRARLEDGSEVIPPEIRDILNAQRERDGLPPLPEPGDEIATEASEENLWDSIWNTASSSIDAAINTITGYEQNKENLSTDLSQMEENQKYLTERLSYLKSDDVIGRMDAGKLSVDEIEQATYAYDPGYWNDFHDRHPQPTEQADYTPANPDIFQSGGVKQSILNMSKAQGYISDDGIFVAYDPNGIDANVPASRFSTSANADGLGISTGISVQNAFSTASSGEVNQSTIDPEKLAEIRASLSPEPQTIQVAQNNAALTL